MLNIYCLPSCVLSYKRVVLGINSLGTVCREYICEKALKKGTEENNAFDYGTS